VVYYAARSVSARRRQFDTELDEQKNGTQTMPDNNVVAAVYNTAAACRCSSLARRATRVNPSIQKQG